jgi:thiosulfate reductase cytochrome b subunit
MPDQDPVEFTDREKFILSFYRDPKLSREGRIRAYDIAIGIASLACLLLFVKGGDAVIVFVGYALLLGRLWYLVVEGGRWTEDFRSIFAKYDTKLRELTGAVEAQRADRTEQGR